MDVINRQELALGKDKYFGMVLNGGIFIHPTDTIYGLGCDATNSAAVEKLRVVKQRSSMPFSVIAPSKKWIYDNCIVSADAVKWVERLPGPYTLILKLSNFNAVSKEVNLGSDTLGIRIPRHWFSKVVEEIGIPVVTTSANVSGQDFMTSIENVDSRIASRLDFAIYEGEKKGKPSAIVKLAEEKIEIIER
ncbi:threonylcarbamoyl-AMP synthase [Candidatus Woesearchaeota archaeon]|nr:threonylcarbamoyl-AMP synthase [Candidatus Woesearchaeota archaeon]